jgi:hypothetical protein
VEGLEIDEQHAAFERGQRATTQTRRAGKVDVEAGRRRRLQRQPQRLAPSLEVRGNPLELFGLEVAGIGELQDQKHQELALDCGRSAHWVEAERLAIDAQRAGAREGREQFRPLASDQRSLRYRRSFASRARCRIWRPMSGGSTACHLLRGTGSLISRANAA